MNAIQLEFDLKSELDSDKKLDFMQKQIDELIESMGKVRKKLFSEMSEMKKVFNQIIIENQELKNSIEEMKNVNVN